MRPHRKTRILLLITGILGLTLSRAFGQIILCDSFQSHHPIDIRLLQTKDSLIRSGIDTIILYRHSLHTNGFNGYGKAIWINGGQTNQLRWNINHSSNKLSLSEASFPKSNQDSLFNFFILNKIDTLLSPLTKPTIYISHDGSHFVDVYINQRKYCNLIADLIVQTNEGNALADFIDMLKEDKSYKITIEAIRVEDTKKKRKKNNR